MHGKRSALELSPNRSPNPGPWKNYLPGNLSLVPNRLGTTDEYVLKISVEGINMDPVTS